MNTGEDAQGLRKIMDLCRLISVFILAIHFYLVYYGAFLFWGLQSGITDRIVGNFARLSWLKGVWRLKLASLLFLALSLLGVKGKKDAKQEGKILRFT